MEREHFNRPAGLRTHIVVCVGASLVMVVSQFMHTQYGDVVDPGRLGAQVISGIGFLGAGTIIKEKFTVKGLTTAASLWAVSCIGIAIGAGCYVAAVIATFFLYITLVLIRRYLIRHSVVKIIGLQVESVDKVLDKAIDILDRYKISVHQTQIAVSQEQDTLLEIEVSTNQSEEVFQHAMSQLLLLDGVTGQHVESEKFF